ETLWSTALARKIGIKDPSADDRALGNRLLKLMADQGADFTNTFAALSEGTARDQFTDREAFDLWEKDWAARLTEEPDPDTVMRTANPVLIPRN
ncbi:hypothetical protein MD537_26955, partial [Flavihumibacter sediminis]|nr:hypothetical protein [Flavihumibacter sediminis]